jgi:hypothetical protein
MTGEITLRGRVLPIGGLKEKLLAALRGGIKTVLIPEENAKDLAEIMLQTIHDKLKGWVAGWCSARSPRVRVLGHQLDPERAELRRQGQRQWRSRQRRAPGLSAAARAGRAPAPTACSTMPAQCDQEARARRVREQRGLGHARR